MTKEMDNYFLRENVRRYIVAAFSSVFFSCVRESYYDSGNSMNINSLFINCDPSKRRSIVKLFKLIRWLGFHCSDTNKLLSTSFWLGREDQICVTIDWWHGFDLDSE